MARLAHVVWDPVRNAFFGPSTASRPDTVAESQAKIQAYAAWLFFAAGCVWALHFLLASQGVRTQDAIAHFVISREAWHRPGLILHHWGRPLNTLLYMPAAYFGLVYARLTALALAAATVLLTLRLARQLDVEYAFAVPLLLWFQPWFVDLSVHPALSEIPFSLMMVLGAILFLSNKWTIVSLVIGLMPLIRHEAIALVGLWVVVCALRRQWARAFLTVVPVAGYTALYNLVFGQVPGGDFRILPGLDQFGFRWSHPSLLHFPKYLVLGAGFPVAGLALYSLPLLVRSAPRLAILAGYGVYMVLHMALFRLGYAVGDGSQRYMFPMAPIVAIAAAIGLGALIGEVRVSFERLLNARGRGGRLSQVLLAVCIAIVLAAGLSAKPAPIEAEAVAAQSAVAWLRQNGLADGQVVSTHVYVHYFLPGHLNEFRRGGDPEALMNGAPAPSELPPGTVAVWDSHYSGDRYGLKYEALASDPQWTRLKEFDVSYPNDDARFVIFRKHGP